jgi:hypothetical protein
LTAKWCPGCRREIAEPPLNPTTTYAKFWRDNLCYICDSRLRPLESPQSANSADTPTAVSPPIEPQSPATLAQRVRHYDEDADLAAGVGPGSPKQQTAVRGDLATRNEHIEPERTHDEILNAYLAAKNPLIGIPVLIRGVVQLIQDGKVTDGINLLNVGHTILVRSGITPDANPYIATFAKVGLYCWVCDRFMATPDGKLLVCQCASCKKTFCPEHARPSAFRGRSCPYCTKRLLQAKARRARALWSRYGPAVMGLTMGIFWAYVSNYWVTSPERVLSARESFVSSPFEFRYVGLTHTQVVTDEREKSVVMLDLSVQGQPFKAYGSVSHTSLQELNLARELFLVKGYYETQSGRYVLSDLTIPYPWWGYPSSIFYLATRSIFNHRLAVMTASFGIWFVVSAIWTLFKMSVSEEMGELADIGLEALGEI